MSALPIPFDWFVSDTHINHVRIREFEPLRLAWGDTLDAHNGTILAAWNRCVKPGQRVLHLGDWAMGQRDFWPGFRARMNGEVTLLLGNHDRKAEVMEQYGFKALESLSWVDSNLGLVFARHDPAEFTPEEVERADVLLHGHLHTGKHRSPHSAFGPKAVCLSIEVLPRAPEPLSYEGLLARCPRPGYSR
jgi:calcineurin-like phosphoesterase family protein